MLHVHNRLKSSYGIAVSDGQVVGSAQPATDAEAHAFSWTQAGGMRDLGTLGGTQSDAFAVDGGQVVGESYTAGGAPHAFSWTQWGGMVDLGTFGGTTSWAWAVDNGQVVGGAYTAGDVAYHAFSWTQAGGIVDLGTLGGMNSGAAAVSNGQVVGTADTAGGRPHAFSWTQAGGMADLGALGPKDWLVWRWRKGEATTREDFGVPTGTTSYTFCLYAGTTEVLIADAAIPADSMKWAPIDDKGYKFKDLSGSPDGIQRVTLKAGAEGKSKVVVKGRGANLPDPVPLSGLPLPVKAQLLNSSNDVCFGALYDAADVKRNQGGRFKAIAQ